ncbi:MAG: 5-formyltetrahydrofolate cyclo-ligase [Lachnospiraceae bacterium]|nr:5-formyltetrahydrofolate cyclo-ligase [Lachnospiraceae bacterium]
MDNEIYEKNDEISKEKNYIRRQIQIQKSKLLTLDICRVSRPIIDRVVSMPEFADADAIYTYLEYNQEVITHPIVSKAWEMGKRVAVPRVINKTMDFYYIESFDDVIPGFMGILEPIDDRVADEKKVFIVMPGLAYDLDFNRIGYGGRYYDNYFAEHKNIDFFKVALVYDFQIIDHINTEPHDVPVDAIVTMSKVYRRE